jgi:hypothetical protein
MLREDDENVLIITTEELRRETARFKEWSGPILVKLLADNEDYIYSLGSGGLIKYKERYFAITNEHVVRSINQNERISGINIPYKDKNGIDKRMTIIAEAEDKDNDIAAFEISPHSVININNCRFLEEDQMEKDVKDYIENTSNIVFSHGYPMYETTIDYEEKVVSMETLPYTTFIDSYDQFSDIIMLTCDLKGISEFGNEIEISTFGGMSGSLIYGYYKEADKTNYKCLGILSFWEQNNNRLGVYPINDVLNFVETAFFSSDGDERKQI